MSNRPDPGMISRLLAPRSVAVVGASDKPGALGASVLGNLDRSGFAGPVYPINPKREMIGTRRCLASVEALPEGVDVAVLAIPQAGVLDAICALAGRKVGGAIVFSAGFAEGGEDGAAAQAKIAQTAAAANMVVLGPNCLGLTNHVAGVPLTFVETRIRPPVGRRAIGVVSQSGAMAAVLCTTLHSRDLAVSYSVSTGNEAASAVEDYAGWLVDDPDTHVIAMIVEQFRDPQTFLAVAARARAAGKPVILLHPGKSSAARESAATHTGALAGDHALMRAKVERAGAIFAETLEELGDIAEIAVRCPPLHKRDLAVLGESGFFKALSLDLCEELGIPLAPLDDASAPELRAALPSFVPVSNPLDITAQGLSEPSIYTHLLSSLLTDARVGAVVAGIIQGDPVTSSIKVPAILAALEHGALAKPLVFAGLDEGAEIPPGYVRDLRARGVPWFPSTERAFRALARLGAAAARDPADRSPPPIAVPGLVQMRGVVPEYRAKQLLAPAGVPFPAGRFAASADEAAAAAEVLGYPVALKAQAASLSHKSDAGGVILHLDNAAAVRSAWERMQSSVAAYDASIALDGVLVEKMGARGLEMIVGARRDPEWGPVIMAGFGGVAAEVLKDVRLITPDADEAAVIAELMRLKQAPLLAGYRGSPPLDVTALARLIVTVAGIMTAEPSLIELDLNPVVLHPAGRGVVALDALMLVAS